MTKTLNVAPFDPDAQKLKLPGYRPIEKLLVTPNPNDGNCNIKVALIKKQQLLVVVFDMTGKEYFRKRWEDLLDLDENINLNIPITGSYILRALTDNDAREVKLVVNK